MLEYSTGDFQHLKWQSTTYIVSNLINIKITIFTVNYQNLFFSSNIDTNSASFQTLDAELRSAIARVSSRNLSNRGRADVSSYIELIGDPVKSNINPGATYHSD